MARELAVTLADPAGLGGVASAVVERDREGRTWVTIDGVRVEASLAAVRPGTYSLLLGGRAFVVDLDRTGRGRAGLAEAGVSVEHAAAARLRAASGRGAGAVSGERVVAPIAGKVVKVLVAVGDRVEPGQAIVVVEAMKMENEIAATRGGEVTALGKGAGTAVEAGELLVELR